MKPRVFPAFVIGCLVAVTLLPHPALGQARGGGSTNGMLREAAGLEASGDLEGAERVLRHVLERDPRATGALFALERVLRSQGQPEAVLPVVRDFLSADPGRAQVRLLELRVLAEVDSLDAVRRRASAWAADDPSPSTYRELVVLYESTFGVDEALELLRRGRSATDDEELLAFEMGDLLWLSGDARGALAEWVVGVGDDGSGVAPMARRIRDLPDGGDRMADDVIDRLAASPVFARRRAAAALAVELRMDDRGLELTRLVADELGGRARSAFLAEIGDRARELSVGGVATWAYAELGQDARTPAERRAFDERLAEVSLTAGDTLAAAEAVRRIARSYPEGSTDRRQAALRALRLGLSSMAPDALKESFDGFVAEFPSAPELDELAAGVARALQAHGDPEGALAVAERSDGPRSAAERAYLLLDAGRVDEARSLLTIAVEGLSPSDATGTIRLVGLLGRLSPGGAETLARAVAAAHRAELEPAIALLESGEGAADDRERAALLAHAARLAEDGGEPAEAARLRTALLEMHPDDPAVPEAALALARFHASSDGGRSRAIEILEELIATRPNAAIVPSARAELSRLRGTP
ncbi:MAG: hypothetical protein WD101_01445 [Gemmatimonadota bacterium]